MIPPEVLKVSEAIDGWMSPSELTWLYDQATQMRTIVEVGSWKGRSTSALCAGCPGTVYAVDPFVGFGGETTTDPYPIFMKNMERFGNCIPIRCLSRYAGGTGNCPQAWVVDGAAGDPRIPAQVDMVFIDAEHAYHDVLLDLYVWSPRATKVLCGHDRGHGGVARALEEFFGMTPLDGVEGIWAVWK